MLYLNNKNKHYNKICKKQERQDNKMCSKLNNIKRLNKIYNLFKYLITPMMMINKVYKVINQLKRKNKNNI